MTNQHAMETLRFQELMGRDWSLKIEHAYREGNRAADFLVSIGYGYPFVSHTCVVFFRHDCFDIAKPRSILIND
ncbi:hypothetical protein LINPERHAP1_LOCUS12045 [Linum perenne]